MFDYRQLQWEQFTKDNVKYEFELWFDEGLYHVMVSKDYTQHFYKWYNRKSEAYDDFKALYEDITSDYLPY